MKISEFFKNDYVNQASYDNLRKIASLVDGQKNASRKILYTILEKNIKDKIKVSQLGSKVAEFAEYLHGNLDNVIVNLGQDYPGTNNIPLLQKKGNFGTRFANEASASRYIYAYGTDDFFKIFNKDDNAILKHQLFEGAKIEPMFYVPNLPILLINGSEGVSSGFAQKILPRNPQDIKKYITAFLNNKKLPTLVPFYNGFNGEIVNGDNPAQWLIKGKISRTSVNKVLITEVPIGYSLKGYLDVLDALEDEGIIQSYRDKSEDDVFCFEVTIPSKVLSSIDDEELLSLLKLVKKVSENYTVLDENNKIQVFDDVYGIIDAYIQVKLDYMIKRKVYLLSNLEEEIRYDFSKYLFIKNIIEDKLIINKRKQAQIVGDLDNIEGIIRRNDNYDYLLNMNIMSLTEERVEKLLSIIKDKKQQLDVLKQTSEKDMWLNEM